MYQKWTQQTVQQLIKLYPITENWNTLLTAFPFSTKRGIQGKAASLGLRKKRISNQYLQHKHNLFNKWTEESAYLLGYLEADGYLIQQDDSIQVCFQTSDKDIEFIQMLYKITGHTGKLNLYSNTANNKTYKKARFLITSRYWKDSLLTLWYREECVPPIPEELLHHYIRGYFDGDGSVYLDKQILRNKSSFVFASEKLAIAFKAYLEEQDIKCSNIHQKINSKKCWYFQISYVQTEKLRNFMYQGGTLYMKRKYMTFLTTTK